MNKKKREENIGIKWNGIRGLLRERKRTREKIKRTTRKLLAYET